MQLNSFFDNMKIQLIQSRKKKRVYLSPYAVKPSQSLLANHVAGIVIILTFAVLHYHLQTNHVNACAIRVNKDHAGII